MSSCAFRSMLSGLQCLSTDGLYANGSSGIVASGTATNELNQEALERLVIQLSRDQNCVNALEEMLHLPGGMVHRLGMHEMEVEGVVES